MDPLEIKKLSSPVAFFDRCPGLCWCLTAFARRFRSEVILFHTVSLSNLPLIGSNISAPGLLPALRESVTG